MYYWNYFRAVLPGFLWMSTCALPAVAGVVLAARAFRQGNRSRGVVFVVASLAAGLATLLMVGPFLWAGRSESSTDGLIWLFAPIWSTTVLGVAIAIGRIVIGAGKRSSRFLYPSGRVNAALLGCAVVVACLLLLSITQYAFRNGGQAVAERASDPEVLRQLYHRQGALSSRSSVQLFLADNPATPGDVLDALSRSGFAYVRAHVAANSNTPLTTRTRLAADTNFHVRSSARRQQPPRP